MPIEKNLDELFVMETDSGTALCLEKALRMLLTLTLDLWPLWRPALLRRRDACRTPAELICNQPKKS